VFDLSSAQHEGNQIVAEVLIAKPQGEFLELFNHADFKCHFLNLKNGFGLSFNSAKKALDLFRTFDVLHLHFFNPIIAILAIASKKRIIYTEHGNFGFGRKRKWSDNLKNTLKRRFLDRRNIQVVYNSEFTKNYFLGNIRKPKYPENHQVILNGIKSRTSHSTSQAELVDEKFIHTKELLKGKFVIGTTSRFAGFKRIDRLIEVFMELDKSLNFHLLLVGDGVLKSQLEEQVHHLKLSLDVTFTGFVENVRDYQNLMDICVFPSESEPFGLAAVETLSIGKSTLVFRDGGGLVEIVNGICDDDVVASEEDLIKRIQHYWNQSKDADVVNERINYASQYSIDRMAQKLNRLYLNQ